MKKLSELFNTAFIESNNSNLKQYIDLINNPSIINQNQIIHIHHIIPRCWFIRNNIEIDNSNENTIRLSIKDHIISHTLLARYYHDINDVEMSNYMIGAVEMLIKKLDQHPDILSQDFIPFINQFKFKKYKKYSEQTINDMFDEYSKYENTKEGYEAVKYKFNFKATHDQLKKIFLKNIDSNKVKEHRIKTDRYWRNKQMENRMGYKEGKNIKTIGNKLIKTKSKKKLRLILDECNELGEEYVKNKYGFYSMYNFFKRCKRLGIITDDECIKYGIDINDDGSSRSMKYGKKIINEMINMFKNINDGLSLKEIYTKIALKFNISNKESIQPLLYRWMNEEEFKTINSLRKDNQKSFNKKRIKDERKKNKMKEMYEFYINHGTKEFKEKYNIKSTSDFLRKCRKLGIMTSTIHENRPSKEISYKGKVQSLKKWLIELNLDGKRHAIIRKHNKDGMSYVDIFDGYLNLKK